MQLSVEQVLVLLGSKEVEIFVLQQRVAALEASLSKLQELTPKAETTVP